MKRCKNTILFRNEDYLIVSDNNGKTFKISTEDESILVNYWSVDCAGYVHRGWRNNYVRTQVRMHRVLIPNTEIVDHINGDKADNRRENIRACTRRENNLNSVKKKITGYKGVKMDKRNGRYRASITSNGKRLFLGSFATEIEAAFKYDEAARKHHGEFARGNFSLA